MLKFLIVFEKYTKQGFEKRFAANFEITAYNKECAETVASSICDNMPQNWTYRVEEIKDGN